MIEQNTINLTLDFVAGGIVWFLILCVGNAIINVAKRKKVWNKPYKKFAIVAFVISGLALLGNLDSTEVQKADKNLTSEDQQILIAVKQGAVTPGGISRDLHQAMWKLFQNKELSEGVIAEVFSGLCSADTARLKVLFWTDVLATLESGQPVRSDERAALEERFARYPFVERNKSKLEAISRGEPIQAAGEMQQITKDDAEQVLAVLNQGYQITEQNCAILRDPAYFD